MHRRDAITAEEFYRYVAARHDPDTDKDLRQTATRLLIEYAIGATETQADAARMLNMRIPSMTSWLRYRGVSAQQGVGGVQGGQRG